MILVFTFLIFMIHDIFLKYLCVLRLFTMIVLKRLSAALCVRKFICTVAVWGLQNLLPQDSFLTYISNHEQRWE